MNKTNPQLSSIIPALYYQTGSKFVDFMEQYYKWMDSLEVDLISVRDPQTAEQEFVDKFLDEYGPTISLNEMSSKEMLVHHITELYRSKGTPRSIDLFFRLVYGVSASTRFPREQMFITSSNTYRKSQYVEVTNSEILDQLLNQVVRFSSGAIAFVETVKYVLGNNTSHNVIVLSDIIGQIVKGDSVYALNSQRSIAPQVVGSLSEVDIKSSNDGFTVGTPVIFKTAAGREGTGYVNTVAQYSTEIDYGIMQSGSGYSMYPEIRVSDKVVTLANSVTSAGDRFGVDANVRQILYSGTYSATTNATFTPGQTVYLTGTSSNVAATVVFREDTQDSGGKLILQSSAPSANILASNTVIANSVSTTNVAFASINAVGKVVGQTSNVILTLTSLHHPVAAGQSVYQYNGSNVLIASGKAAATQLANTVYLTEVAGNFVIGTGIKTESNAASTSAAVVSDLSETIGIDAVSGKFYPKATTLVGNTTSYATFVSSGYGTKVGVYSLEGNLPVLMQNADPTLVASGALQTTLGANTLTKVDLGGIASLRLISEGSDYDVPPMVTIKQPMSSSNTTVLKTLSLDTTTNFIAGEYVRQIGVVDGTRIVTTNNTSRFAVGDLVYRMNGANTAGVGIIDRLVPNQFIYLRAINGSFPNTSPIIKVGDATVNATPTNVATTTDLVTAVGKIHSKTSNTITVLSGPEAISSKFAAGGKIVGDVSGAVATIASLTSANSVAGNNAVIASSMKVVNGTISTVTVEDSGYGFQETELVSVQTLDGTEIATGTAKLKSTGTTAGYFENDKGMTSSSQRIADGLYYQPYSYVVTTAADITNKEADKKFLQVAGMAMFIDSEISNTYASDADLSDSDMSAFV